MSEERVVGVQDARENLRAHLDAALERGEHTVITRNGRRIAVLVDHAWYVQQLDRAGTTR